MRSFCNSKHSIKISNDLIDHVLLQCSNETDKKLIKKDIILNFLPKSIEAIIQSSNQTPDQIPKSAKMMTDAKMLQDQTHQMYSTLKNGRVGSPKIMKLTKQTVSAQISPRKSETYSKMKKISFSKENRNGLMMREGKYSCRDNYVNPPELISYKASKSVRNSIKNSSYNSLIRITGFEKEEDQEINNARDAFQKKKVLEEALQQSFNLFQWIKTANRSNSLLKTPTFTTTYDGGLLFFGETEEKKEKTQQKSKFANIISNRQKNVLSLRSTEKMQALYCVKINQKKEPPCQVILPQQPLQLHKKSKIKATQRSSRRNMLKATSDQVFKKHLQALRLAKGVQLSMSDQSNFLQNVSRMSIKNIGQLKTKPIQMSRFSHKIAQKNNIHIQ